MISSRIGSIFITAIVVMFALYTIFGIITGQGNSLGNLARICTLMTVCVGVVMPKQALYLLIIYGCYVDLFKRTMILDLRLTFIDIAWVLSLPIALVGSLVLARLMQWVLLGRKLTALEIKVFVFGVVISFASFIFIVATQGPSLTAMQLVANLGAYTFMPFVMLGFIEKESDLMKYMRFCILISIPAALYGIKQWVTGFSNFEVAYMETGLTVLVGQLDNDVIRPFSTVSNPGSFAVLCFFGIALSLFAICQNKYKINQDYVIKLPKIISIICILIFLAALLLARIRTVWMVIPLASFLWIMFKTYKKTISAYFIMGSLFLLMVMSSKYILENNILEVLSKKLISKFGHNEYAEQALQLQTWAERLKGYRDVLSVPSEWPLFWTDGNSGVKYHDDISRLLYSVGAIPTGLIFFGMIVIVFFVHKLIIVQTEKGWHRSLACFGMAGFIALLARGIAAGFGATVFPSNLIMYIFLSFTVLSIQFSKRYRDANKLEIDTV